MANMTLLKKALPLLLPKHSLRCPVSYNLQRVPHISFKQVIRAEWFHHSTFVEQRNATPRCSRTIIKGQTLQQLCFQNPASKIHNRTFFSFRKRKTIQEIQKIDNVDSHYELVYSGNSISYLQLGLGGVQLASAAVTAVLCSTLSVTPIINFDIVMESPLETSVFIAVNALICIGIFTMARRYPFRIYYSELEDQFIAVFVGIHPLTTRSLKIKPGEVQPVLPSKIAKETIPWAPNMYAVSSQQIYLDTECFSYPVFYNKLLGYN